jgi:nitroimidazol reductase NimA-like FMN-containing flavoprotein (pyridoxamine 5'-phosphate oxidase superfamily)
MPRADISMSIDEIRAFLRDRADAVVGANSPEGTFAASVARFRFRDDVVRVRLRADDAVLEALRHDDRVCVAVEQFPSYREIQGVIVHGRPTVTPSPDPAVVEVQVDLGTDIVSFDFAKIPV